MESEADYMGLAFMNLAGYNMQESVEVWKRMKIENKVTLCCYSYKFYLFTFCFFHLQAAKSVTVICSYAKRKSTFDLHCPIYKTYF